MGNSSADIAVHLVNQNIGHNVTISTRSGAWIVPNYISEYPSDLYVCRSFLNIPWQITTHLMQLIIKFINGNPKKYLI